MTLWGIYMVSNLYWVTSLLFAFVLIVLFFNDLETKRHPNREELAFRRMITCDILFCLQDVLWGICACGIIESPSVFFFSSSIFHLSTVIASFLWLYYVIEYLSDQLANKKIYLLLDGALILFELVLVIINCFTPVLFRIYEGEYITGHLRPLTFANHYIVFVAIGIVALVMTIKAKQKDVIRHERYRTVLLANVAPIVLGGFQLLYPDGPFYSMGYFVACVLVYLFVVTKDRNESEMNNLFKPIAKTFYSLHIIDLERDTVSRYIETDLLKNSISGINSAQEMIDKAMEDCVTDEYLDSAMDFVDFSTLSERMKEQNQIFYEFVGKHYGWTRFSFISVEKAGDIQKKVMFTSQIIDEEKNSLLELVFNSNNDELTGLNNRRAFEDEIKSLDSHAVDRNLVFVSMDVNGLKVVNDTLGHAAGDELLKGAAECMRKCFSTYGKVYRIGGDEFAALLTASRGQLNQLKKDFDDIVTEWSGELVDSLSVSVGYVTKTDIGKGKVSDMQVLADERMYQSKDQYYRQKGIDRRGQKDAHVVLCARYNKILKIDINNDTYQIVSFDSEEPSFDRIGDETISGWFKSFAERGGVHPDDVITFEYFTSLPYLRNHFSGGNEYLNFVYRRKYGDKYKPALMELIAASDFNEESSIYLYVKYLNM